MGNRPFITNDNMNCNGNMNQLTEGDRIRVISAGGLNDTGVFLRFEDNFLVWVRDNGTTPDLTFTSLFGISISLLT